MSGDDTVAAGGLDPLAALDSTGDDLSDGTAPFSLLAAFRVSSSHPVTLDGRDVPGSVRELEDVTLEVLDEGVRVRGWYDVSGFRADADLLVWLQGEAAEDLQWSLRQLRRTALMLPLIRTWSVLGVAQEAVVGEGDPKLWASVASASPVGVSSAGAGLGLAESSLGVTSTSLLLAGDQAVRVSEADDLELLLEPGGFTPSSPDFAPFTGRSITTAEIIEVLQ